MYFIILDVLVNLSSRKGQDKSFRLREAQREIGGCILTVSLLKGIP